MLYHAHFEMSMDFETLVVGDTIGHFMTRIHQRCDVIITNKIASHF